MKVLLVEDEKQISKFVKASLEAEGFLVDVAEDGERGAPLDLRCRYLVNLPKSEPINASVSLDVQSGSNQPLTKHEFRRVIGGKV